MTEKTMNWVDLSAYNLKLSVIQLKSGSRFLVIPDGEHARRAAEALDFTFNGQLGFWIMRGSSFSPKDFVRRLNAAGLEEARLAPTPVSGIVMDLSAPRPQTGQTAQEAPAEQTEAPPENDRAIEDGNPAPAREENEAREREAENARRMREREEADAQLRREREEAEERSRREAANRERMLREAAQLGVNRLGQMVYEYEGSRFIRDRGSVVPENKQAESGSRALFLRASDASSLALCADSIAVRLAEGKSVTQEDLDHFLEVIHGRPVGPDDQLRAITLEAVDNALARHLARYQAKSSMDAFTMARRLHEGRRFGLMTGGQSVPLPVAVVTQRIIGTGKEIGDKALHVSGNGSVSLLANLPKGVNLKVFEQDGKPAGDARLALSASGMRADRVLQAGDADWEADFQIANLVGKSGERLAAPVETDGLEVSRSDLAEVLRALEKRPDAGRSCFLLTVGEGEDAAEAERVLDRVARRYTIEGIADVEGGLCNGGGVHSPMRILLVGQKRPEELPEPPEAALRRREIQDFASLWSWASEVASNRAKIADYLSEGARDVSADGDPDLEENSYQVPYVPTSKLGQSNGMVPRNLAGPIREALAKVARKHGDIDEWVARELAMSQEELAERLSPDQVDAIALSISANERNRGFMLADQTGRGKGRILAAMIRWAVLKDRKVLFLTEKAMNISDIWRDIRDIGADDIISPLIVNANTEVIDPADNSVLLRSPKASELAPILEADEWPEEHNLILATYSQFNRSAERSAKSAWIRRIVDENALVLADECHNASSRVSNTSTNIEEVMNNAGGVVYSSATFAKDSRNMSFYIRLFPDGMDADELMQIIRDGGETMQEVISTMLAKDGVMIRREHDLSRCEYRSVVDAKYRERNFALMDRLAPILAEMAYLGGDIDRRLNAIDEAAEFIEAQQLDEQGARRPVARGMQMNRVGFGSRLYNLSKLFLAAIKIDATAELAVEKLNNNEKPIILVENTLQALLSDLRAGEDGEDRVPTYRDFLLRSLDTMTVARRRDGRGGDLDLVEQDEDSALRVRMLRRAMQGLPAGFLASNGQDTTGLPEDRDYRSVMKDALQDYLAELQADKEVRAEEKRNAFFAYGNLVQELEALPEDHGEGLEALRELVAREGNPTRLRVQRIRDMISALPDIPISIIDEVKERIEAAGFTCGEITGRTVEFSQGRIRKRERPNSVLVKNAFNNGEFDALIMNNAASTGIDLNASRLFRDQRKRSLVIMQGLSNVVKHIQAFGRIMRLNQVNDAEVVSVLTGLPMELRLDAMMNAKLRRMSANVTSNRDNPALIKDIPDMINSVGDTVCSYYGAARPDLMRRIGFEVKDPEEERQNGGQNARAIQEDRSDNQRSANSFLARLVMLPVDVQEQVANEIFAEFEATVEELDAKGINPLRTKELAGTVHEREKYLFEGTDVENPDSVFHEPVYATRVHVETPSHPLRSDRLTRLMESAMDKMGPEGPAVYAERLRLDRERLLQIYLPPGYPSVQDAINRGVSNVATAAHRLDRLTETLSTLRIGSDIHFTDFDDTLAEGVVIGISMPSRGYEHLAAQYEVEIAIPGDSNIYRTRLVHLLKDQGFSIGDGLNGDRYEEILDRFDEATDGVKVTERTILTGNLFKAMMLNVQQNNKLGAIHAYRDADRIQNRGLVVSGRFGDVEFIPLRIANPEMASAALRQGIEMRSSQELDISQVIIKCENDGGYRVHMPGRRNREYRHIYQNEQILALVEEYDANRDRRRSPVLKLEQDQAEELVRALHNEGIRLYTSGRHRAWANAWLGNAADAEIDGQAPDAEPEEDDEIMEIRAA